MHQPPHLIGARVLLRQDWVSVFHGGTGTITIKDHASGKTLLTAKIPLTPGPLVVVVCLHCTVTLSRARIHTAGWAPPADYDSGVASQPSSYSRGACSCLAQSGEGHLATERAQEHRNYRRVVRATRPRLGSSALQPGVSKIERVRHTI